MTTKTAKELVCLRVIKYIPQGLFVGLDNDQQSNGQSGWQSICVKKPCFEWSLGCVGIPDSREETCAAF